MEAVKSLSSDVCNRLKFERRIVQENVKNGYREFDLSGTSKCNDPRSFWIY